MNKPDWDTWRHIPLVDRWEAAALSLDIDPDSLRGLDKQRDCRPTRIAGKAARAEFDKRRRIIESQLYDTLPGCINTRRIELKPFAAWARRIGWSIPPELAALADSADLDLQAELERAKAQLKAVSDERDSLAAMVERMRAPGDRAETTYRNIIGGLLALLVGKSESGRPNSVFTTQSAIIEALRYRYPTKPGLSKRTLEDKLPEARKSLEDT
jgi:hypothetical protein